MADTEGSGKNYKLNPLFSQLASSDDAITLRGFIAPSGRDGYIRLFNGLGSLSKSIEIAESDILATVDLPKSSLGAVAVLVKRQASLHHHLIETAESFSARKQNSTLNLVNRGGLRMRVKAQASDVCTCEIYCDGKHCVPCTSECLAQ
jgi:hypothetical protein